MSEVKYGIRLNSCGRERASVVKIVKQTEKTYTYIVQKTWRPEDPDFSSRETRTHDQPLAVCDTLAEAEALAKAANAAWADHAPRVAAAEQAYRDAGKEQLDAFNAALSGAAQ